MRPLSLYIAVIFLTFFRARWAFRPLWNGNDDSCYRNLALFWTGLEHGGCASTSYFPGVALLWAPSAAATWLTSSFWGVEHAMGFWVGWQSFAFWFIGLLLLRRVLVRRFPRCPDWVVLVLALNVPVLYYATARTSLPHAGEWVLALWMWDLIEQKRLRFATLVALWLTATRFNDAPALLMLAGAAFEESRHRRFVLATVALSLVACGFVAFDIAVHGYNGHPLYLQFSQIRFGALNDFLWGSDWGVIWASPLWISTLGAGLVMWRRLSWTARGAWTWMLSQAILCANWPTNGSDFAYRYLIGSFVGAIAVGSEIYPHLRSPFPVWAKRVSVVAACWMALQTWVFRTHPLFTPAPVFRGYRTAHFQYRTLMGTPAPLLHKRALELSPTGTAVHLVTRHRGSFRWGIRVPELFGARAWGFLLATLAAWARIAVALTERLRGRVRLRPAAETIA